LLSGRGRESVRPLALFEYLLWADWGTPEERAHRLEPENRPCYPLRSTMRLAAVFVLLLALTAPVRAQTGPAVVLSWDPPRDDAGQVPPSLTGYQLQRCTVPEGQSSCTPQDLPQAIVPATQTSYSDTEVTRGARYIYTVVALCLGCQSHS